MWRIGEIRASTGGSKGRSRNFKREEGEAPMYQ